MEFFEFAQILRPIIGGSDNTSVFVCTLFDAIITDDGRDILEEVKPCTYKTYFNGNTGISRIAQKISPYIEPEEFVQFCRGFSDAVTENICKEFQAFIPEITVHNAAECLAELFQDIIKTAAGAKRKSPPKKALTMPASSPAKLKTANDFIEVLRRHNPSLNTDCYNLFVYGADTFEDNYIIVDTSRSLSGYWTLDEIRERYLPLSDASVAELKNFPALFMPEAETYYARAGCNQRAYLGVIDSIRVQDNGIKVKYTLLYYIPLQVISENGFNLGMKDMTKAIGEMNHTHWALKRIDLLDELICAKVELFNVERHN